MADHIFEHPRLASIYDAFDGERDDLQPYVAIAKELHAQSILDVGCGTGSFPILLSSLGFDVIGLEPAEASLDVAMKKLPPNRVRWILGDIRVLTTTEVDVAFMTANVAQVFLTDSSWHETLMGIRNALRSDGHLVFEVRDPAQKAWNSWNRENTYRRLDIDTIGTVEGWCELTQVSGELVSFCWSYHFHADGVTLTSDSTLRFRSRESIESSLHSAGFSIKEIRDAPDRPGKEFVFIAQRCDLR